MDCNDIVKKYNLELQKLLCIGYDNILNLIYVKKIAIKQEIFEKECLDVSKIEQIYKISTTSSIIENSFFDRLINNKYYNIFKDNGNIYDIVINNKRISIVIDECGYVTSKELNKLSFIFKIMPFGITLIELYTLLDKYSKLNLSYKIDIEQLKCALKVHSLNEQLVKDLNLKQKTKVMAS